MKQKTAENAPAPISFRLVRLFPHETLAPCADSMRALEKVADKALQLGESALCSYRSHSSSQCKNAALLHYAVSILTPWKR